MRVLSKHIDERSYLFCILQYAVCVSLWCICLDAKMMLGCCMPCECRPHGFLFWPAGLQAGATGSAARGGPGQQQQSAQRMHRPHVDTSVSRAGNLRQFAISGVSAACGCFCVCHHAYLKSCCTCNIFPQSAIIAATVPQRTLILLNGVTSLNKSRVSHLRSLLRVS